MSLNWLGWLKTLGPMILGMNPATAGIAPFVVPAIEEAEAIPGATGPQKLAHALDLIRLAVAALNAAAKKVVVTLPSDAVISGAVALVIKILNLLHHKPAVA